MGSTSSTEREGGGGVRERDRQRNRDRNTERDRETGRQAGRGRLDTHRRGRDNVTTQPETKMRLAQAEECQQMKGTDSSVEPPA